ncbi:MAG: spore cortex biosynthesis protein YabQ [Ruminococcus sp.]|nr:spore cortex biosynthesis protein YabQ [Ruminococcus sp.]
MIPSYMFEPETELSLFALSIAIGVIFGVIYEATRIVRIIFPHRSWLVFLEDMLFMLFCGFWFFIFSMTFARGQLRGFLLLGNLLGFFLYIFTLGELVKRVVTRAREIVVAALKWIGRLLWQRLFKPMISKILRPLRVRCKKIRRKRKKSEKSSKKVLKV